MNKLDTVLQFNDVVVKILQNGVNIIIRVEDTNHKEISHTETTLERYLTKTTESGVLSVYKPLLKVVLGELLYEFEQISNKITLKVRDLKDNDDISYSYTVEIDDTEFFLGHLQQIVPESKIEEAQEVVIAELEKKYPV